MISDKTDIQSTRYLRQMGQISFQSSVSLVGTVFTVAIGYFFKVYIAHRLGAAALGIYTLGMSAVGLVTLIATLGLPLAATRFVATYSSTKQMDRLRALLVRGVILITIVSLALGVLMALSRGWVATLFNQPYLSNYVPFFALLVPLSALGVFFGQVLRGYKAVTRNVIVSNFIQFPTKIVLTIGMFALGFGLWGYIGADIFSTFIAVSVLAWSVNRRTPLAVRMQRGPLLRLEPAIISLALVSIGTNLIGIVSGQTDRILLGIYSDIRQVGIYSIVLTTVAFVPTLLRAVNSIFGPVIAELYAAQDRETLLTLFQTLTKWTFALTFPLVLVIVAFAPAIMRLFGAEFEAGWLPLALMTCGELVNVGTGSVGFMLLMSGNQNLELIDSIINMTVTLLLYFVLIPRMSILGAGISASMSNILVNLLRLWQVKRRLGITPYNRSYWRLVLPVTVSVLATIVIHQLTASIAWPAWIDVILTLFTAYGCFGLCVLGVGLNETDRLLARSLWTRIQDRVKMRSGGLM